MNNLVSLLLLAPALASAQDFWGTEDGFAWSSAFIWQDGLIPGSSSTVSFQSCMGDAGGKIRIEEPTSVGRISFANAKFALSDGASLTFSSTSQDALVPISASCEASTSGGEGNPQGSTNGSGTGGEGDGNVTIIVAVVAAVLVIVVAAMAFVVVKKRKAAGGTTSNAAVSFDNPMYDDTNGADRDLSIYHSALDNPTVNDGDMDSQYDEPDSGLNNTGGYMDVNPAVDGTNDTGGYMDVEGAANDTGGYMDVEGAANDAGYLDVEPEPEEDLGGDDV